LFNDLRIIFGGTILFLLNQNSWNSQVKMFKKNFRVDKAEHPELHIKRTMFLKTHIADKLYKKSNICLLGIRKTDEE